MKKKILMLLAIVCGLVIPISTQATSLDGNRLYSACKSKNPTREAFCHGYIQGIVDGLELSYSHGALHTLLADLKEVSEFWQSSSPALRLCIPRGVPPEQLEDIVLRYLENNPQSRHLGASISVREAIRETFPCSR